MMDTGKSQEFTSPVENGTEMCTEDADAKSWEEEETKDDSLCEDRMQCDEAGAIKTEPEEGEELVHHLKAERGEELVLKEEAEGSEDGMEEGLEDQRTGDEEDERNNGGDGANEPEDLSLVDYSQYDGAAAESHMAAAVGAGGAPGPRGVPSRVPAAGKLNCDICGLSCVSINVLLVHKRSHTGERPFHCNQCGASFTQKGNLLRHIKLHTGEKPFKCPMCSYACRRRDALSGHMRTHSVEKPYKCNHCSRSYKQRSSLEEHRERCHVYIQAKGHADRGESHTSRTHMGPERALLLDRLASNVAKRKNSVPQKFTGDNGVCLDLSCSREPNHRSDVQEAMPGSPDADSQQHQQHLHAGLDGEPAPLARPYTLALDRNNTSPLGLTNGHKIVIPGLGLSANQQPFGMDSFHSDSSQMSKPITFSLAHLLGGLSHHNGLPHPHGQPIPLSPMDALRSARADGEAGVPPGAVYPCGHCRVIFLDYVMFTIHMGCHGFRDPLECNMCGHRSRDRYEFSSHIARGEHCLELK